jgi:dTDP-4-amino-4,6-dideoxygalactose transaminase
MRIIKNHEPFLAGNEIKFINDVVKLKKFTDSKYQKKCEEFIKKKINSNFLALTQNCTSALEIASILINIRPGDEVILPSYTFTSTANAVVLRGANIKFADVDLVSGCIKLNHLESLISPKTKAVIIVHYGAYSCDMELLILLKKKYNFFLIEDAAHSFGGKYNKKYLGTWGDIGAFSFHETKNFIGGQCGAISINNKKLESRANLILDKGTDRKNFLKNSKKHFYSWKDIGSEYRATELSAALLYGQFINFYNIQNKREKMWNYYYNRINKNYKLIYVIKNISKKIKSSYHNFFIIFKNKKLRNNFIQYMKTKNIICTTHYHPLHKSSFGKFLLKYKKCKLVNTDKITNGLVRLPFHNLLSIKDLNYIVKCANNFLKF